MEKKCGLYICKGCGIADCIDIEKLAKNSKSGTVKEENIKVHDVLCNPEGLQSIKSDIKKDGINTLIIAASTREIRGV
jgi:quinone-modifying oxidoreductase, subunit QmoB